jgi:hypothetical protein
MKILDYPLLVVVLTFLTLWISTVAAFLIKRRRNLEEKAPPQQNLWVTEAVKTA